MASRITGDAAGDFAAQPGQGNKSAYRGSQGLSPELVARILRNPLATDLTIVCSPAEIAEAGVPIDRFSRVISCPAALDSRWREVLAARAESWLEVQDAPAARRELLRDAV